jgi:hypothetical protein
MKLRSAITIVGGLTLTVGVWFIYWPAGLIVAGGLLMFTGLFVEGET